MSARLRFLMALVCICGCDIWNAEPASIALDVSEKSRVKDAIITRRSVDCTPDNCGKFNIIKKMGYDIRGLTVIRGSTIKADRPDGVRNNSVLVWEFRKLFHSHGTNTPCAPLFYDNLGVYDHCVDPETSGWRFANVLELQDKVRFWHHFPIDSYRRTYPRALLLAHFVQLAMHDTPLFRRIRVTYPNRSHADGGGKHESGNFARLPATFTVPFSIVIGVMCVGLFFYGAYFSDYPLYYLAVFTMPPFAISVVLFILGILPDPPSIFGLAIGP